MTRMEICFASLNKGLKNLWRIHLQLTKAQVFQDIARLAIFIRAVYEDLHVVVELSELAPLKENQVLVKFFLSW